jgi:hypothetical protein
MDWGMANAISNAIRSMTEQFKRIADAMEGQQATAKEFREMWKELEDE